MKISTLVGNRFALSSLENKLVMIDDDMIMSALKDTDLIKEVITNNGKMVMERKNNPFYEGDVYARIIAFANGTLDALYDKSEDLNPKNAEKKHQSPNASPKLKSRLTKTKIIPVRSSAPGRNCKGIKTKCLHPQIRKERSER